VLLRLSFHLKSLAGALKGTVVVVSRRQSAKHLCDVSMRLQTRTFKQMCLDASTMKIHNDIQRSYNGTKRFVAEPQDWDFLTGSLFVG